jgi:hypothetical protein
MPYDTAGNFQNSLTITLGAGPYNDLAFGTLQTQLSPGIVQVYVSGVTNRLFITPASGGTTINSLDASGCSDGFRMLIVNASSTDNINFTHQGGGTATNQFFNVSLGTVALLAGGATHCTYVINRWRFG